jgi:hypothetical protein
VTIAPTLRARENEMSKEDVEERKQRRNGAAYARRAGPAFTRRRAKAIARMVTTWADHDAEMLLDKLRAEFWGKCPV